MGGVKGIREKEIFGPSISETAAWPESPLKLENGVWS